MVAFLKGTGVVVLLLIGTALISAISPEIGLVVGVALLLLPGVALLKPLPKLRLGHRGFSFAVMFFVGLPATIGSVGMVNDQKEAEFSALKENNPDEYLRSLKDTDQDRWMSELAEIDPEQHAAEKARIAEEEARRVAEVAAAREAEEQARIDSYVEQLDREIASIPGIRASKYTEDVASINTGLIVIGAWALFYEEGAKLDLPEEALLKRQQFRNAFVRKQTELLPAMRDAYGPAMRKQLWEADGSARTIGAGYRTVEFVSVAFARNANIKQIHTDIYENLMMLRFTRAQYKWIKHASEFSYYTLEVPKDSDIVRWESSGRFKVLE